MTVSNYTQIAQGMTNVLGSLSIGGSPQTLLQLLPSDRAAAGVSLPSQQITLGPAAERPDGSLNKSNDWEYPYLLTFMQVGNQDTAWDSAWLSWRRQVQAAFHGKRPLASTLTTLNPLFRVEPSVVVETRTVHDANLTLGQMLVWARTREARTITAATSSQTGGNLIYTAVGQAVQAVIQAIGLAGITAGQVTLVKTWTDRLVAGVNLANGPQIIAAIGKEPEREVGPNTATDYYYWPVLVTILKAMDQNIAWDDSWFLMRQQIRDAFHLQLLTAVGTALWCEVEPRVILDPGQWHDDNVGMGQLLVRVMSREDRT